MTVANCRVPRTAIHIQRTGETHASDDPRSACRSGAWAGCPLGCRPAPLPCHLHVAPPAVCHRAGLIPPHPLRTRMTGPQGWVATIHKTIQLCRPMWLSALGMLVVEGRAPYLGTSSTMRSGAFQSTSRPPATPTTSSRVSDRAVLHPPRRIAGGNAVPVGRGEGASEGIEQYHVVGDHAAWPIGFHVGPRPEVVHRRAVCRASDHPDTCRRQQKRPEKTIAHKSSHFDMNSITQLKHEDFCLSRQFGGHA